MNKVGFMPPKTAEKVEGRILRKKKPKHSVRKW